MDAASIAIRPLESHDDYRLAAEFQREIWGVEYDDVVPATLLHVVNYVGGLAAGAFDPSGALLGFVFGINGLRDGETVHWSHMLGVRETARNLGVGRRLKEYQRHTLGALGVRRIYWSFDPLMAKNAHFNLNRLGARVVEYVPDMYGTTSSPLHLGMATDRLIVCLDTAGGGGAGSRNLIGAGSPVLTAFPRLTDVTMSIAERLPESALIEIPEDVLDVLATSPSNALTWRHAVRDHLQWALAGGYSIGGVHRDDSTGRVFYVATREASRMAARAAS